MSRRKSFKNFMKDVVNPYLKDKGLEVGRVIRMDYLFDIRNEDNPSVFDGLEPIRDSLKEDGVASSYFFFNSFEEDYLEKKYNGDYEKDEFTEYTDKDNYIAQEEFEFKIFKNVFSGQYFSAIKKLVSDNEELERIFKANFLNAVSKPYYHKIIFPDKSKVTVRPEYDKMFDVVVHGRKEYISNLKDMLVRDPSNSFRYNLDMIDVRRWAEQHGIDVSKYNIICHTEEEIAAMVERRNTKVFREKLEHYKYISPGNTHWGPVEFDASGSGGRWPKPDAGNRVRSGVKITVL